jgi:class 3 adenylate cyclase
LCRIASHCGDVGGPQQLNYTAHGNAVIIAARLEAAGVQRL